MTQKIILKVTWKHKKKTSQQDFTYHSNYIERWLSKNAKNMFSSFGKWLIFSIVQKWFCIVIIYELLE